MNDNQSGRPSSREYGTRGEGGKWKKYVIIAVIAAIVMGAGAVVGAGVTIMYVGSRFSHHTVEPDLAAKQINERIAALVSLTLEEREKVEDLVSRQMAEVAGIREKYEEEITQKLGAMSDGLSDVLGSQRADKCGSWMRRYRGRGQGGGGHKHRNRRGSEECCENTTPQQ